MEYTISEIGLKVKNASSMAKTVSIIRKYNKLVNLRGDYEK